MFKFFSLDTKAYSAKSSDPIAASEKNQMFKSDFINTNDLTAPRNQDSITGVGYLRLILGPMFSAKTSKLLGELSTHADVGMNVLFVNHAIDERQTESGDGSVSTHSSQFKTLSPKITPAKTDKLAAIDVTNYGVIGVDEGQFFDDLVEVVTHWVDDLGKIVFVAGLDGDFQRKPIGKILNLIPQSDHVDKLIATCQGCLLRNKNRIGHRGHHHLVPAPFTARKVINGPQVVVGGSGNYMPLCRWHYRQHMQSTS